MLRQHLRLPGGALLRLFQTHEKLSDSDVTKKNYDEFVCRELIGNDDLKEPYRISSSGCVWLELVIDSRDSYLY